MVKSVNFGLIGTGAAARNYYVKAFREVPEARLTACYDALPQRARDFAVAHGCDACDRIEELLARRDIEAVIVVTQVQDHAAPTVAACRAGKHVLCEKPMAATLAEADEMIAAARAAGVLLGGIFQMRVNSHFPWLRARIAAGQLGKIQTVDILFRACFRGRRDRPDLPGGLVNILSHDIDFALNMVGPIERVEFARVDYWHPEMTPPFEDMAVAVWRHVSGARGTLNMSCSGSCGENERTMTIVGERGFVVLESLRLKRLSEADGQGVLTPVAIPDLRYEGHTGLLRDFALAIREGRSPMITGEQHREPLRVVLEILALSRQSRF